MPRVGAHGKWWTYTMGCRCDDCRYAFVVHCRANPGAPEDMCPRCGRWYQSISKHETKCVQRYNALLRSGTMAAIETPGHRAKRPPAGRPRFGA